MGTGRTPALWERKACAPNLYNAPPAGGPIGFLRRQPREDTCCPSQPRPVPKPVVRSGPGRVVALPFSPLMNLHPGHHPGRCSGTDHAGPPTFPVPVQGVPAHPLHPQDPVATPSSACPSSSDPVWPLPPGPPFSLLPGLPLQELVSCFTHDSISSFSQRPKSPPAWP